MASIESDAAVNWIPAAELLAYAPLTVGSGGAAAGRSASASARKEEGGRRDSCALMLMRCCCPDGAVALPLLALALALMTDTGCMCHSQ